MNDLNRIEELANQIFPQKNSDKLSLENITHVVKIARADVFHCNY